LPHRSVFAELCSAEVDTPPAGGNSPVGDFKALPRGSSFVIELEGLINE